MPISKSELRQKIISVLTEQGFIIDGDKLKLPDGVQDNKDLIRQMQAKTCAYMVEQAKDDLCDDEPALLSLMASGSEVNPDSISPRLISVESGSLHAKFIWYVMLHIAVPTVQARGRVRRFLVEDTFTGKIMGAVRVGSPLRYVGSRDEWIGWDSETRDANLHYVGNALTLVSIPPYSHLMAGKLMALVGVCDEVRDNYRNHYDDELALLTTTSAFGRSSVYNRLKFHEELVYQRIGWTQGWGNFHFNNEIYPLMREYVRHEIPEKKGFNRWKLIDTALRLVGFPSSWSRHGIRHEVFVMPMADNSREFLQGKQNELNYIARPFDQVSQWWRERWMLKRASWDKSYLEFTPEEWRFWDPKDRKQTLLDI